MQGGALQTFCVALAAEGLPPHELFTFSPHLSLPPGAESLDWQAVSDALRGFVLRVHQVGLALPAPIEGAHPHPALHV